MKIEVTGCSDCPFSISLDMMNGYECSVDGEHKYIQEGEHFLPVTPEWCPLKKEEYTITIKSNTNER